MLILSELVGSPIMATTSFMVMLGLILSKLDCVIFEHASNEKQTQVAINSRIMDFGKRIILVIPFILLFRGVASEVAQSILIDKSYLSQSSRNWRSLQQSVRYGYYWAALNHALTYLG